ncbi:MAG: hypothetical protein AAFV53_38485 [Myxococcota bacterium]
MATIEEHRRYTSELTPSELRETLAEVVEPVDWPFPLVFKLSGGGIVSRVMDAPKTDRPFFGQIEERIRFAVASRGNEVTAFQPILRLTIEPDADNAGSVVQVRLRPHGESRSFAGLFAVFGGTIAIAALPALFNGEPIALIGVIVGLLGIFFPPLRARLSFQADRDRALDALTSHLPLTAHPPSTDGA